MNAWPDELAVLSDRMCDEGMPVDLLTLQGVLSRLGSGSRSWSRSGSQPWSGSQSWSRSGSQSWSRSWSGSRSWSRSWSWSRSGSQSSWELDNGEEVEMQVGQVVIMTPLGSQSTVGRVVDVSALEVTLDEAVLIHDFGSRQAFEAGRTEGDGQRAHVSRLGTEHLPRLGCRWSVWAPGEEGLKKLRAWGDQ